MTRKIEHTEQNETNKTKLVIFWFSETFTVYFLPSHFQNMCGNLVLVQDTPMITLLYSRIVIISPPSKSQDNLKPKLVMKDPLYIGYWVNSECNVTSIVHPVLPYLVLVYIQHPIPWFLSDTVQLATLSGVI